MSGANDMFECVCQFFRQQSDALQGIMNGLGNQNTISDIGGDGGQLPNVNTGILGQISPMQMFMFLLLAMWTYMFMFSQQAKAKNEKPARGGPSPDGQGSGSSSSRDPPGGPAGAVQ